MRRIHSLLVGGFVAYFFLLTGCQKSSEGLSGATEHMGFRLVPSSRTNITTSNDLPETQLQNHFIWDSYYNGGGVAAGDVNNDGLADLYFTNTMKHNVLYINRGNWVFEDVTEKAGVRAGPGVNWGAVMADINGDGWLDIYVCKSGSVESLDVKRNECFINQKDGTFREMAGAMGIDNPGYSVHAAFFDYDLDNDLDLFVMNQPSNSRLERQKYETGEDQFVSESTSDRLFRNNGNMTFTDVSEEAGVVSFIYGLGLKICDLNGDHWPDVYVASDYKWPDHVLINNRNGTFTNKVYEYFDHIANFSMGMDVGDINNDAMDDIFVLDMAGIDHYRSKTNMPSMSPAAFWKNVEGGNHYQYMHNVLQLNRGNEKFSDIAYQAGVAKTDWSWGAMLMDADNDGFQDIYVTNGIKRDIRNSDFLAKFEKMIGEKSVPQDIMQLITMIPSTPLPNFMFHNEGHLHFSDKAQQWNLAQPSFSNGCAFADLDLDGDLDIVVNNVDAEAFVYENKAEEMRRSYIQFGLKTSRSRRPVEGTRINLYKDGKICQSQYYHPVRGFMSTSEHIVHFGLGDITTIDSAEFIWPDRNISVMPQPELNKRHIVDQDGVAKVRRFQPASVKGTWVSDKTASVTPRFEHKENMHDDYAQQLLLPYKISTLGPGLAVGDVNDDGLEDFFVGGASGQAGTLYLQNRDGTFGAAPAQPWSQRTTTDILGALFFDTDTDGDLDLYLARGGSEFEPGDMNYQDLLFLNDGKGRFSVSSGLPVINASTKAIASADWDGDGDADLFVGSRNTPMRYPYPDRSYFLQNDGGKFTDVTGSIWAEDAAIGMITDAVFYDKDGDGDPDLLVCGDWMAPSWLMNESGTFVRADLPRLQEATGWWNTVALADINGDGVVDILAGNAGLNNKFKAKADEPFIVLASDFDQNGASDIVLATHYDGKEVPVRGRECSSQQLAYIAEEFPTFEGFAKASLQEILGRDKMEGCLRFELNEFRNGIFWGTSDGDYTWEAFPVEAQFSPVVGFVLADVNGDGTNEVIAAGNLFDMEIETTRYDAGKGVILGYNSGKWVFFPPHETGFYADGNVRNIRPLRTGGSQGILLARSGGPVSLIEIQKEVN